MTLPTRSLVRRSGALVLSLTTAAAITGAIACGCSSRHETAHSTAPPAPEPFGLEQRVAWTTSNVKGSPEAPPPYITQRAFPKLHFNGPLDIEFCPGSDRVFVLEQKGKILSFHNNASVETPDLLMDVSKVPNIDKLPEFQGIDLYGLAFHPDFQKNHYCYVCYALNFPWKPIPMAVQQNEGGSRLSRFRVSDTDPPRVDPKTEEIIFQWQGSGHNGGSVKFGPDGFLYLSTGDNGNPNPPDPFQIGQNVGDVRSKILRLDVDHADGNKKYSIPADNPFVNTPGARGEVWAYGLRNPWRMSFDRSAGGLWVGDVGWELWESVHRIDKGGNYGWSIMEGPNPVYPNGKMGPSPIIAPQAALPHTESASITGGFVYHGKRLPELQNQYIFGDWSTRTLWAAPCDGKKIDKYKTIAQTEQRIVAFGEDADGELYIADHEGGGLWQIAPNPAVNTPSAFPRNLSATGLFTDVAKQEPSPGVVTFTINAPQFLDGSTSERFAALPTTDPVTDDKEGNRKFPKETVLVRTFSLETKPGDANSRRKVETQLLHFDGLQWHGYSYQWNDAQTDAALVGADGLDQPVTITDASAPGGRREQVWHYASRNQCMTCHTQWTHYAMAFNEEQTDRVVQFASAKGTVSDNQLRSFRHIGLIPPPKPPEVPKDGKVPPPPPPPLVLVNPNDESHSLDERAKSYLHVNCSACHRFGGGGTALFDVRADTKPEDAKLFTSPMLGSFDIHEPRIVCQGDPSRSVMLYRMAKSGHGHMPHIGATMIDGSGLKLLAKWMAGLQDTAGSAPTSLQTTQQTGEQNAAMAKLTSATVTPDVLVASVDTLLGTTEGAMKLMLGIEAGAVPPAVGREAVKLGSTAKQESVRDLFTRFLPPDPNQKPKLGTNPDLAKLLALPGDVERGRKVFFETSGGLCAKCHIVDGKGLDFGPNLSHIATKYGKADILDNILHPSKTILQGYETYVVRTKTGNVVSGFLVSRSETEIVIKDAERKLNHIAAGDVDKMQVQPISAMPEGIISDLDPQQAADLLEYLSAHK
ncbi:MAG TPA: PQQ-dependent sugar dehydrogenase [Tepidisphaeraceae bacterium]|jgi:putative heme-binding domain-containing protein|nr:PQQ-dependent sugar dehydrogenase [Tepidisphaeraceae bacterium]